jgi:TRAP transporter TAXI family solute receptor
MINKGGANQMKNSKFFVLMLLVAVVTLFATGNTGSKLYAQAKAPAKGAMDKSSWPQRLTLASGPTGSFSYTMGSPWASNIGALLGVTISTESTAGLPVNALMVNNKQAEIGICSTDIAYDTLAGAEWSQGKKLENIRAMAVFDSNVIQFYTNRRSGIKTFRDINGKSVNPSRAKSNCDTILRRLVKILDVKPSKITNVNPTDANGNLGDGLLDVAATMGSIPHPAPSEFEVNHDMVLFGLTREDAKKFSEQFPALSIYEIPANSYKNQKEPVITVGSYSMAIVGRELPDSIVYEMTKATFGSKKTLAAAYKPFAQIEQKNIIHSPIPLHPGAIKYYEEQGVKIPDRLKPSR